MFHGIYRQLQQKFDPADPRLTRRAMLATLSSAAGLLLTETLGATAAAQARVGKRILVVGAGFGGLSTAYELTRAGYDVTVVEARDRLSGRVHSLANFVGEKTVEAGGELIGANQPTWAAYAQRFGLKFVDLDRDQGLSEPMILGGKQLSTADAKALWEEMRGAFSQINTVAADIDADRPWTHPQAVALDQRSTASWIAALDVSETCKLAMTIQLTAINGMLPAWQSLLANLAMIKGGGLEKYWTETDLFHCVGGNQQLAQKLAEEIGRERIHLNSPVTAITVRDTGAVALLADGRRIEADDLVLTVPVSTWSRIAIDPPLPAEILVQMGMNLKFLVALKSRFWKAAKLSPRSLTDGPVCLTWEATNNQGSDAGACLTAYSGGPSVDTVLAWDPAERSQNYLAALESLYPEIGKYFEHARFMNWPNDPWSKGSYSFPAPGQVTTAGPILQTGLGHLHFAGEYTCYAFIGYMEGALNSGVQLARRLAIRDGIVK